MSVVINDSDALYLVYLLEASYRTEEIVKTLAYAFPRNALVSCGSYRSQRIEHVVVTGNVYSQLSCRLVLVIYLKVCPQTLFAGDNGRVVIAAVKTEGYLFLVHAVNSLVRVLVVAVENDALGGLVRKHVKALYNVFNVLEIFKVIGVNVEYHRNIREEFQEVILIFARLADHYAARTASARTADARQLAADNA